MFSVVITEKGGAQRRVDFDKAEVTIGRVQGNDIILPKGNVSKRHSRIVLKDNRFIVVDLKSTNGTYVNGRKITSPLVVKSGDKIYIGDFIMTLEEGASASPPEYGASPSFGAPASPSLGGMAAQPPMGSAQPPSPFSSPLGSAPSAGGMMAPPLVSPQHAAPAMSPAPMMSGAPALSPAPPLMSPPPQGGGMPPPARSAPPPPRPTLGGPPPLPSRPEPTRHDSQSPDAASERYHLDEEPADETMSPSPRVVGISKDTREVNQISTDIPPARQRIDSEEQRPLSRGRHRAVPSRDTQDPLGHVMATLASSLDVASLAPPQILAAERWQEARVAIDAAIARLESEGGNPGDREGLAQAAMHEALGYGPLGSLLDDPAVLEIIVEGPTSVLADRGLGWVPVPGRFSSADQLMTIVGRLVTWAGEEFEPTNAIQENVLPNGAHFRAVLPPVAFRGPVIEIRRAGRRAVTGETLVQEGVLSAEMLSTLTAAVSARRNIVVLGPADVGPSSFVSMLANLADSEDRTLVIESSPELALSGTHQVRLTASANVPLVALLANGPRLRADRIVIDGVGGTEVRAALLWLASCGAGCILGVRGAPFGAALDHLEALARLQGGADGVGRLLGSGVHVIVQLGRDASGVRRALSIGEVVHEHGATALRELHVHSGEFKATGVQPTFG